MNIVLSVLELTLLIQASNSFVSNKVQETLDMEFAITDEFNENVMQNCTGEYHWDMNYSRCCRFDCFETIDGDCIGNMTFCICEVPASNETNGRGHLSRQLLPNCPPNFPLFDLESGACCTRDLLLCFIPTNKGHEWSPNQESKIASSFPPICPRDTVWNYTISACCEILGSCWRRYPGGNGGNEGGEDSAVVLDEDDNDGNRGSRQYPCKLEEYYDPYRRLCCVKQCVANNGLLCIQEAVFCRNPFTKAFMKPSKGYCPAGEVLVDQCQLDKEEKCERKMKGCCNFECKNETPNGDCLTRPKLKCNQDSKPVAKPNSKEKSNPPFCLPGEDWHPIPNQCCAEICVELVGFECVAYVVVCRDIKDHAFHKPTQGSCSLGQVSVDECQSGNGGKCNTKVKVCCDYSCDHKNFKGDCLSQPKLFCPLRRPGLDKSHDGIQCEWDQFYDPILGKCCKNVECVEEVDGECTSYVVICKNPMSKSYEKPSQGSCPEGRVLVDECQDENGVKCKHKLKACCKYFCDDVNLDGGCLSRPRLICPKRKITSHNICPDGGKWDPIKGQCRDHRSLGHEKSDESNSF